MAMTLFVTLWVIFGIIAFIWSLICFGRQGTVAAKVGGLVLSILFGPLALIYIVLMQQNTSYCN